MGGHSSGDAEDRAQEPLTAVTAERDSFGQAGAMALQVGRSAPDFTLKDQHGQDVELSSFRGSKAVTVMFYPFAFSGICTGELHAVRDDVSSFRDDDLELVAVSCDHMFSLRAYAEREDLNFPLLSDFWPHGEASKAYGVFEPDRGAALRGTFVIDRGGLLRWQAVQPIGTGRDLDELRGALEKVRR